MGVMDLVALGCRVTQFIFAVISLGLVGYSESSLHPLSPLLQKGYLSPQQSPSQTTSSRFALCASPPPPVTPADSPPQAAHWYNAHSTYQDSPTRVNFLIFVSLWTLLALIYLALTPRFFPSLAHKYAILGLDFVTMIFWFAGWIALAVYKENLLLCGGNICHVMTAAIVFGALEW